MAANYGHSFAPMLFLPLPSAFFLTTGGSYFQHWQTQMGISPL
jgi:hypothetical protein